MDRIGLGYDIHRLIEGRKLILAGVEIPYIKGLLGHSDADVLAHAVIDALLGAAGLNDIGENFPDTDMRYQGADSMKLLKTVHSMLKEKGFCVNNIDAVIVAQEPQLTPFKEKMRLGLAGALELDESYVAVKAKTNEGIGELGRAEAIAAYAVVLLRKE